MTTEDRLIDVGQWHHVEVVFTSAIGTPVHLMLEDCCDDVPGSVPEDAYFDNIRLET